MGKVTGIAAILLCATAVLFVRAKHPDAIGKWRVKLGLQTSCPDERKKVAPSKRVRHLQYEAPYDFGEEFLVLDAWHATREEFLDGHIDVWYSSDGEKELSVRKDLVRFFGYEICENVLKFGERGVERVLISVFNKGRRFPDSRIRSVVCNWRRVRKAYPGQEVGELDVRRARQDDYPQRMERNAAEGRGDDRIDDD